MNKLFIYILIMILFTATVFSCVGYQASYGGGFGVATGPYGVGAYPRVNVGVYGGGYPRYGY